MLPEEFDREILAQTKRAPLLAWERLQDGVGRAAAWAQVGRLLLHPDGQLTAHCWDDLELEGKPFKELEPAITYLREGHARLMERRNRVKEITELKAAGTVTEAVESAQDLAKQSFLTTKEIALLNQLKVRL